MGSDNVEGLEAYAARGAEDGESAFHARVVEGFIG
jgi:hypothetical protein